jgi:hypothetical protein
MKIDDALLFLFGAVVGAVLMLLGVVAIVNANLPKF